MWLLLLIVVMMMMMVLPSVMSSSDISHVSSDGSCGKGSLIDGMWLTECDGESENPCCSFNNDCVASDDTTCSGLDSVDYSKFHQIEPENCLQNDLSLDHCDECVSTDFQCQHFNNLEPPVGPWTIYDLGHEQEIYGVVLHMEEENAHPDLFIITSNDMYFDPNDLCKTVSSDDTFELHQLVTCDKPTGNLDVGRYIAISLTSGTAYPSLKTILVLTRKEEEKFACDVCECSGTTVICINVGLTAVPADFPEDTTSIVFSENKISHVSPDDFSNLPNLQSLAIHHWTIDGFPDGIFDDLPQLISLRIQENTFIRGFGERVFSKLYQLKQLWLYNNVGYIDVSVNSLYNYGMCSLTQLSDVRIVEDNVERDVSELMKLCQAPDACSVCTCNDEGFGGHSGPTVNCEDRSLKVVPAGWPDDTEYIFLGSNKFTSISESRFSNLKDLRVLKMSNCLLEAVPDSLLHGLYSLTMFSLERCKELSEIPHDFFRDQEELMVLDMSACTSLTSIHESAFDGARVLETVYLDTTGLVELPVGLFDSSNTHLKDLYLQKANLHSLPAGFFSKLPNIQIIWLYGNDQLDVSISALRSYGLCSETNAHSVRVEENIDLSISSLESCSEDSKHKFYCSEVQVGYKCDHASDECMDSKAGATPTQCKTWCERARFEIGDVCCEYDSHTETCCLRSGDSTKYDVDASWHSFASVCKSSCKECLYLEKDTCDSEEDTKCDEDDWSLSCLTYCWAKNEGYFYKDCLIGCYFRTRRCDRLEALDLEVTSRCYADEFDTSCNKWCFHVESLVYDTRIESNIKNFSPDHCKEGCIYTSESYACSSPAELGKSATCDLSWYVNFPSCPVASEECGHQYSCHSGLNAWNGQHDDQWSGVTVYCVSERIVGVHGRLWYHAGNDNSRLLAHVPAASHNTYASVDTSVGKKIIFVSSEGLFLTDLLSNVDSDAWIDVHIDYDIDASSHSFSCSNCRSLVSCGSRPITPDNAIVTCSGDGLQGDTCSYECEDGYVGSIGSTECRSDGTWSDIVGRCEAISCGTPPVAPSHAKRTCSDGTNLNDECIYICSEGYSDQVEKISCQQSGDWTSLSLSCTAESCGEAPVIHGIDPHCSGSMGDTCLYECLNGYNGESRDSTCTHEGEWTDPGIECTLKNCGPPPSPPQNGALVSVTETTFNGAAIYGCLLGYTDGREELFCLADGTWEHQTLTCPPESCLEDPPSPPVHSSHVCTGSSIDDICSYRCNDGYTGVTKESMCQDNGEWESITLICNIISCGAPVDIDDTIHDCPNGYTFGSECHYECDDGFSGGDKVSTCKQDKTWSDPDIRCNVISCGDLPSIPHGASRTCSGNNYADECSFSCNTGSETEKISCQLDGTWELLDFSCDERTCGSAPVIENADRECNGLTTGSSCTYRCKAGYSGSASTSICGLNDAWSPLETACVVKDCGPPPTSPDDAERSCTGTKYLDHCEYSCHEGYSGDEQTLLCQSNGVWENLQNIDCIAKKCGVAKNIQNTVHTCDGDTTGKTCTYECLNGYSGEVRTSTCGVDSLWSNLVMECELVKCGSAPESPYHSSSICSGLSFGDVCTYQCDDGYIGSAESSCQADGEWESYSLICSIISCDAPLDIDATVHDCPNGHNFGSECRYECAIGLTGEDRISTCKKDKTWSDPGIICNAISCGDLPDIPDGVVRICSGDEYNDVCSFSCDNGSQSAKILCQVDGSWQPLELSCIQLCDDPPSVDYADRLCSGNSDDAVAGDECSFSCWNGYVIDSAGTSTSTTCNDDGSWSDLSMSCVPIQCDELTLTNDSYESIGCTGTIFSSTCSLECAAGFIGESGEVTCGANGKWSSPTFSCTLRTCPSSGPSSLPSHATVVADQCDSSSCTIGCLNGYSGEPMTLQCHLGIWPSSDIVCLRKCTSMPVSPPNTNDPICTGNQIEGATCKFSCSEGYSGEEQVTRCLSTGNWESVTMLCAKLGCGEPPVALDHSTGPNCDGNFDIGSSCTYSCRGGFEMAAGTNALSTCQSSLKWSIIDYACTPAACDILADTILNVQHSCPTDESVYFGEECSFSCNDGYTGTTVKTTCEYDGRWSLDSLTCVLVNCGDPPAAVANSQRHCSSKDNLFGDSCLYSCNSGYIGNDMIVTCGKDGLWIPSKIEQICRRPKCENANAILSALNARAFDGSELELRVTCDIGYATTSSSEDSSWKSGSWTLKCQQDIWSWADGLEPVCDRVSCEEFLHDGDSLRIATSEACSGALAATRDTSSGGLCVFSCADGPDGSERTLRCVDGRPSISVASDLDHIQPSWVVEKAGSTCSTCSSENKCGENEVCEKSAGQTWHCLCDGDGYYRPVGHLEGEGCVMPCSEVDIPKDSNPCAEYLNCEPFDEDAINNTYGWTKTWLADGASCDDSDHSTTGDVCFGGHESCYKEPCTSICRGNNNDVISEHIDMDKTREGRLASKRLSIHYGVRSLSDCVLTCVGWESNQCGQFDYNHGRRRCILHGPVDAGQDVNDFIEDYGYMSYRRTMLSMKCHERVCLVEEAGQCERSLDGVCTISGCIFPAKEAGTSCDDGVDFTIGDICRGSSLLCIGDPPPDATATVILEGTSAENIIDLPWNEVEDLLEDLIGNEVEVTLISIRKVDSDTNRRRSTGGVEIDFYTVDSTATIVPADDVGNKLKSLDSENSIAEAFIDKFSEELGVDNYDVDVLKAVEVSSGAVICGGDHCVSSDECRSEPFCSPNRLCDYTPLDPDSCSLSGNDTGICSDGVCVLGTASRTNEGSDQSSAAGPAAGTVGAVVLVGVGIFIVYKRRVSNRKDDDKYKSDVFTEPIKEGSSSGKWASKEPHSVESPYETMAAHIHEPYEIPSVKDVLSTNSAVCPPISPRISAYGGIRSPVPFPSVSREHQIESDYDVGQHISVIAPSESSNIESHYDIGEHEPTMVVGNQTVLISSALKYLEEFQVNRQSIHFTEKQLGSGQFGEVVEGTMKLDSTIHSVAIKTLKVQSDIVAEEFLHEAVVMTKLKHPFVLRLFGILAKEKPYCLVTELCPMGNMLTLLQHSQQSAGVLNSDVDDTTLSLPHDQLLAFSFDVAAAVQYIHEMDIIHRDIATRNLLVVKRTHVEQHAVPLSKAPYAAKLSDFGLARLIDDIESSYQAAHTRPQPIKWMAPEALFYGTYDSKSDVWSYGVCLWEMYTWGETPWVELPNESSAIKAALKRGDTLQPPEECPSKIQHIMNGCFMTKAQSRLDLNAICNILLKEIREKWPEIRAQSGLHENGNVNTNSGNVDISVESDNDAGDHITSESPNCLPDIIVTDINDINNVITLADNASLDYSDDETII